MARTVIIVHVGDGGGTDDTPAVVSDWHGGAQNFAIAVKVGGEGRDGFCQRDFVSVARRERGKCMYV